MGSVADKANRLIGVTRNAYQCNQVVNEIFYNDKDVGKLAVDYLTWGVEAYGPGEGVVVVGKDGKHVGVFVNDYEFVHSSETAQRVIKRGMDQLPYAFSAGWVYRKEQQ